MHRLSKLLPAFVFTCSTLLACRAETSAPKADARALNAAVPTDEASARAEASKAASEQLPNGAELLAAQVEASGGAEQIAKFESIHIQGTVKAERQALQGTMRLWWQQGGKVYLEQDVEGVGMSRFGYDGETAWLDDPITGLRKLEGAEAASYLQSSQIFLGHEWQTHFSAANTLGRQSIEIRGETHEVWEVELVSKAGPNVILGIDTETKLISSMQGTLSTSMGPLPIKVFSDRYEPVQGYKFSMHKINTIKGLLEVDETITKIDVNVALDPTMFAFPSKRELVEADPERQPPIEAPAPQPPAP